MTSFAQELRNNQTSGKKFANRPLRGMDFSKRNGKDKEDLCNADFRNAKLIDAVFDDSDCTGADFTDANCNRASFRNCKLYKATFKRSNLAGCDFEGADLRGITITLSCDTFENLRLPSKWLAAWLFFPMIMDIPEDVKMKLEAIIGPQTVQILKEARMAIS